MAMGETLVIDPLPELVWGTYYGGSGTGGSGVDGASAVAVASDGDIILAGETTSTASIATAGSHQVIYDGWLADAYLARFSSGGVRLWGTYYGGIFTDRATALAVTPDGDIVMAGLTLSEAISTAGSHQEELDGSTDAILVRFTSGGKRLWGTYYGGPGDEYANALAVAPNGDILIAGQTTSTTAIATADGHQSVYARNSDAFLVRFTAGGVRLWGTYYGGRNDDIARALAVGSDGIIVMAGQTSSSNAIATPRSHQDTLGGVFDAFLVRFTLSGVRLWGTYYGGRFVDNASALAVSSNGDIVMAGDTRSSSAIATTDSHQVLYGGGDTDAFVVRFTSGGSRLWGTYYGGAGLDNARALAVALGGEIVMAGYTSSIDDIASAGSHQAAYSGFDVDAFFARFKDGGVREWGTYCGGDGWDEALALAIESDGDIVLAGRTSSTESIATAGSHQATSGGSDAFLARFRDNGSTSVTTDQAPEYVPSIRSVQPNPAAGSVTIVCEGTQAGTIDIVDVQGRIVRTTFIDAGMTSVPISIADLAPGSYRVRFMSNVSSASGTLKASVQALVVVP
jgi:uncharacterized delta-60 repeat protein